MHPDLQCYYFLDDNNIVESIWQSENTIFSFDTNIFLNLYSLQDSSIEDFFKSFDKIKNKLFLPFHVALEYENRRIDIIAKENKTLYSFEQHITTQKTNILNMLESIKDKYPELYEVYNNNQKLLDDFSSKVKNKIQYYKDKNIKVNGKDHIREKINTYISGKTGQCLFTDEASYNALAVEAQKRYDNKIPPGYKDATKDNDSKPFIFFDGIKIDKKYGDFFIFKELIEKGACEQNIKNIIFITDDQKEDWYLTIESNGEKKLGPRVELKREMQKFAGIDNFILCNMKDFLSYSKDFLGADIEEDTLKDVEKTEQSYIDNTNISYINHSDKIWSQNFIEQIDFINNLLPLEKNTKDSFEVLFKTTSKNDFLFIVIDNFFKSNKSYLQLKDNIETLSKNFNEDVSTLLKESISDEIDRMIRYFMNENTLFFSNLSKSLGMNIDALFFILRNSLLNR